ncbi:hypothetical protein MASR1M65_16850 [Saprospiraceae bacterium]
MKPETANSAEISWVHRGPKFQFYITPFFTFLKDAIVTTPGTYNGKDSIIYQDVLSRVETTFSNQCCLKAKVAWRTGRI